MTAVSILLASAQVAFLLALVILGFALINSSNLFTAALNIPLMVTVISLTAAATGCYVAALALIDSCAMPCAGEFGELRTIIISLLALMAAYTVLLVVIAIVAPIPWISSGPIGVALGWGIEITTALAAGAEWRFTEALRLYNDCRVRHAVEPVHSVVLVAAYFVLVAATLFDLYGLFSGKIRLAVRTPRPR